MVGDHLMEARSLEIAIVSFRCEELLHECLTSLREHPPQGPLRIRVVDNASRDGTAEMVAAEFPEVLLTVNERNLGFAAATNLAIRAGSWPYVLALNPDTQVTAGTLDRLLDLIEKRPEVGICGPRLKLPGGGLDHAAKRSFPTPLSALGHFTGVAGRRGPAALSAYTAPEIESASVDAVNGAFMLMRRAVLEEIGLFDEGYWMYMEDLDLCYRAKQAGWVTWYEPSAVAIHLKAGSSGPIRAPRLDHAFHYGMYRFYRKHYAADHSRATNGVVYAGIALKLCVSLLRGLAARSIAALRRGS